MQGLDVNVPLTKFTACEVMFSDCGKAEPWSVAVSVKRDVRAEIVETVSGRGQVSGGDQACSAVVSLAPGALYTEVLTIHFITLEF